MVRTIEDRHKHEERERERERERGYLMITPIKKLGRIKGQTDILLKKLIVVLRAKTMRCKGRGKVGSGTGWGGGRGAEREATQKTCGRDPRLEWCF